MVRAIPAWKLHFSPWKRGHNGSFLVQSGCGMLLWGNRWCALETEWNSGESGRDFWWGIVHKCVNIFSNISLWFCISLFSIIGLQFNNLARWVQEDNETGIYYETWTVRSDQGPNSTTWFDSYDCSQFVHRTYRKLAELGANLSSKTQTNYTKIYLYSGEPTYLGDDGSIFDQPSMKTLATDIRKFYRSFQPHQSMFQFILSLMEAYKKVVLEKTFYLFYNFEYWHLPMKPPYIQIIYEEVPLPWWGWPWGFCIFFTCRSELWQLCTWKSNLLLVISQWLMPQVKVLLEVNNN